MTKKIFEELTLKLMSFNAEPDTACRLPCDSIRCLGTFMPEVDQLQWSPTAHAFVHYQFSHVANFWKQGRQASFRLEALPCGQAELNLTFQLPAASEVIPPPSHVFPASAPQPQRPIPPLFPNGFFPQRSGGSVSKPAFQKKTSSKQRKSYRRSVLHRAALAAPSLPPPKNGSLRQAALAMVKRLQADSVSPVTTPSTRKRSYSESNSPNAHSPSNFHPLAQRIRSDLQIGEDSPEKEQLRMQLTPLKSPFPSPTRGFPSPAGEMRDSCHPICGKRSNAGRSKLLEL